ncbi:dienelactone hydrolase family protein [Stutzerimonas azotifigens]|uniref:dienelactone hydrolase family protein n=1 Tax=Stutzerimonas azotifigens TaxID=291995 RepID=UPI0003FF4C18|nr:dienelactone hydrolase family protein [Stutzerimonas azotifigens]
MMEKTLASLLFDGLEGLADAGMVTRPVAYEIDGEPYEGVLVHDSSVQAPRPGLLMVPNWLGVNEASVRKAARVARGKYAVLLADLYGKAVRPRSPDEARPVIAALRADRPLLRRRARAALGVLRGLKGEGIDAERLGAIGFCFGGGAVLELARDGAPVKGVVSFHGNLDTPDPTAAANIRAAILVLHGALDPAVPPEQVDAFVQEMKGAPQVDWQLVSYGQAVHSFTNPLADAPGRAQYHPVVAKRAFCAMDAFFDELFQPAHHTD